jgi:ribosomal protein S18 acetylase RimI-like enzyme
MTADSLQKQGEGPAPGVSERNIWLLRPKRTFGELRSLSPEIEIRRAGAADAWAIAEVHRRAHRETYAPLVGEQNYDPSDLEFRRRQWTAALAGAGIAYVATDAGRLAGFTHALGDKMTTLYILAAYRRRGIGRALLSHLLAALAGRGISIARFDVFAQNAPAVAFYRAQGARPWSDPNASYPSGR